MINIILFLVSILLTFGSLVIIDKEFGKIGLIAWVPVANIIANIIVCKMIELFGMMTSLGNVMFASVYFATNIINEKYRSPEDAKTAIKLGLIANIGFVLATQFSLLFIPHTQDIAQASMQNLFAINWRTSISSVIMYYLSNLLNIYLFNKLMKREGNKLWVRNNLASMISNGLENFLFAFLAFTGIFSFKEVMTIAVTTTILEIFITICTTPFIYMINHKGKRYEK